MTKRDGFYLLKYNKARAAVLALLLFLMPFSAAHADCADPPGSESEIVYNTNHQVFQYCDGTDWIAMHGRGSGSGGCTDPDRPEGRIVYNPPHRVMQGCAGNLWRAMGPVGGAGGIHVGSCTDPDRAEGTLKYNSSYRVMQYCDGADWVLIGKKIDLTPDAFVFADQTDAALSTLIESNITQITGIKTIADVSIGGDGSPEYRICDDAACSAVDQDWGTATGLIGNGQYLQLRLTSNAAYDTMNSAAVTVGTASDQWDVTTVDDVAPDSFSFVDLTAQLRNTVIPSNVVNITGITGNVLVSISGDGNPEFRVNGGAWTTSGTIQNGQTLQLRLTSNAAYSTISTATVTVGSASDQWDVTTEDDTTPSPFSFTDQANVALSTLIASNIVQITGLTGSPAVSIAGGGSPQYRICSDSGCTAVVQTWTSGAATISNNQYLQLRLTSSASFSTLLTATVTVDVTSDQWNVTTVAQDTTPNAFAFTDQTNVALNTLTASNTLAITGITGSVAVSVSGTGSPQISINGGGWTTSGTIQNGQTLQVRLTSANAYSTARSATVTVGTGSNNWSVTTAACGGDLVGGYCWYTGAWGNSCTQICSSRGGCDIAGTRDYAGSGGTDARCVAVLNALSMDSGGIDAYGNSSYHTGCGLLNGAEVYRMRWKDGTTNCGDSFANVRRACACNN